MFYTIICFYFLIVGSSALFYPDKGRQRGTKLYPACVELNLFCSSTNAELNQTKGLDIDECLIWCRQHKACKWISMYYGGTPTICYLHDGCQSPQRYEGYFISPRDCPEPTEKTLGCFEYDINYKGNDVIEEKPKRAETFLDCQQSCQKSNKCTAWSYNRNTEFCQFKTLRSINSKSSVYDATFISGPADCQGKHFCFSNYFLYSDPTFLLLSETKYSSTEECFKKCNDIFAPCVAFAFYFYMFEDEDRGTCKLYATKNDKVPQTRYFDKYHRTGLKHCEENFNVSDYDKWCRDYYATLDMPRTDYLDYLVLGRFTEYLTSKCEERCRFWNTDQDRRADCVLYVHDFASMACILYPKGVATRATFHGTSVIGRLNDDCKNRENFVLPSSSTSNSISSTVKNPSGSSKTFSTRIPDTSSMGHSNSYDPILIFVLFLLNISRSKIMKLW